MDDLDNRNLEVLTGAYLDARPEARDRVSAPRGWNTALLSIVLAAMRKAGDEALFGSVTVRLERSFGEPMPAVDHPFEGGAADAYCSKCGRAYFAHPSVPQQPRMIRAGKPCG